MSPALISWEYLLYGYQWECDSMNQTREIKNRIQVSQLRIILPAMVMLGIFLGPIAEPAVAEEIPIDLNFESDPLFADVNDPVNAHTLQAEETVPGQWRAESVRFRKRRLGGGCSRSGITNAGQKDLSADGMLGRRVVPYPFCVQGPVWGRARGRSSVPGQRIILRTCRGVRDPVRRNRRAGMA